MLFIVFALRVYRYYLVGLLDDNQRAADRSDRKI